MTTPHRLSDDERDRFDALVAEVIEDLPPEFSEFLQHVPLIVLDRPDDRMLDDIERHEGSRPEPDELCGLHTGVMNTEAGIDDTGRTPSQIHLFRCGILALVGGWHADDAENAIADQIEITLLHEIGHQMGLDEDDLDRLGYA